MALTTRMKIIGAVVGTAVAGSIALVPVLAEEDRRSDARRQDAVVSDEKEALPSFTATDWVSYGDHVAVVRVAAEREESGVSEEEAEAGEGYLSRAVDLRVKERVWTRSGAPTLPDAVSITADGWEAKQDTRLPVVPRTAPRLEVGHDYVITFARYPDSVWAPLGSGGILPYDQGRIGQGEFEGKTVTVDAYRSALERRLVPGVEEPLAFRTAGKTAVDLRSLLQSTPPEAKAAQHFDLDAIARYEKVTGADEPPADTFCSVASPLAVPEASRYTPDELADVLTDLAGMTDEGAPSLRAYAASLRADDGTAADDTARKASITKIEQACGIEVGELLPNDADPEK
ncbi:hypothetical protein ACIF8T_18080 [Streptomyces sp. NPDC085946]|uniref:hypothetical protein n=1 Tax=Streptomyces sp. NPDC085946 TaxID=3365744 RepID=UPI0037D43F17